MGSHREGERRRVSQSRLQACKTEHPTSPRSKRSRSSLGMSRQCLTPLLGVLAPRAGARRYPTLESQPPSTDASSLRTGAPVKPGDRSWSSRESSNGKKKGVLGPFPTDAARAGGESPRASSV